MALKYRLSPAQKSDDWKTMWSVCPLQNTQGTQTLVLFKRFVFPGIGCVHLLFDPGLQRLDVLRVLLKIKTPSKSAGGLQTLEHVPSCVEITVVACSKLVCNSSCCCFSAFKEPPPWLIRIESTDRSRQPCTVACS